MATLISQYLNLVSEGKVPAKDKSFWFAFRSVELAGNQVHVLIQWLLECDPCNYPKFADRRSLTTFVAPLV